VLLLERRPFVHGDMVGLAAFDFILWILLARVVRVSLVVHVSGVHLDDRAADMPGFGVPGHSISHFESFRHDGSPLALAASRYNRSCALREAAVPVVQVAREDRTFTRLPLAGRGRTRWVR
jgi:hypothetical protein